MDYTFQTSAFKGLLVGGGARYVGTTYADAGNTFENNSYFLVDAAIRYDFGNMVDSLHGVTLAFNANNLLDKQYFTCFSLFDCNWGPGRTLFATLALKW